MKQKVNTKLLKKVTSVLTIVVLKAYIYMERSTE